jgi:putative membrane protein
MHTATEEEPTVALPPLILRGALGGVLMGLANLVPGISGGTMLVAAGVYPRFIEGIAEVTALRFRTVSLAVLASVAGSAALAILLLAGPVKDLVVDHRFAMYSLFIGLTLGGLPVVWRMARPKGVDTRPPRVLWGGAAAGFGMMLALVYLQASGVTGSGESNALMLGFGGLAGASAMILPGVSGGYLLLLLGQYVPILSGIDAFKEALRARDMAALIDTFLAVVLPVGLGVVVGIVVVSNLLRYLLHRYEQATLGVLLGLLLGAVFGLWPFQQGVEPVLGETVIKGQVVTEENFAEFDREDYPTAFFRPSLGQVGASLGLIVLGFGLTSLVARVGGDKG